MRRYRLVIPMGGRSVVIAVVGVLSALVICLVLLSLTGEEWLGYVALGLLLVLGLLRLALLEGIGGALWILAALGITTVATLIMTIDR